MTNNFTDLGIFSEERAQVEELIAEVLSELLSGFARFEVGHLGSLDVDDAITPVLVHSVRNVQRR